MRLGYWLWHLSDYKVFPHQDFVDSLDPTWVTDLQLAMKLWAFQHNQSATQQLFEKILSQRQNGNGAKWPMGEK